MWEACAEIIEALPLFNIYRPFARVIVEYIWGASSKG